MKHKLIATFPMPERSSDLNKAHWMGVLQDKNFTLQSIDDEAKKMGLKEDANTLNRLKDEVEDFMGQINNTEMGNLNPTRLAFRKRTNYACHADAKQSNRR